MTRRGGRLLLAASLAVGLLLAGVIVALGVQAGTKAARGPSPTRAAQRPALLEHDTRASSAPSPEIRAATRAARLFLSGYLPYSYARARASHIRGAAPALRQLLGRTPPRVPATLEHDRDVSPHVVSIDLAASNGDLGVDLVAVVDDQQRRYRLNLAVRPATRAWLVVAIS